MYYIILAYMVHMPQRAQKVLSKPVNVMMAKRAQAEWVGDETLGSVERRERAEETTCRASGDVLRAHPWQTARTLSLASHEVLLGIAYRPQLGEVDGSAPGVCWSVCVKSI